MINSVWKNQEKLPNRDNTQVLQVEKESTRPEAKAERTLCIETWVMRELCLGRGEIRDLWLSGRRHC